MKQLNNNNDKIAVMKITGEPLNDGYPDDVLKFRKTYLDKLKTEPLKLLKQLDIFITKYPDFPIVANWKIAALQSAGTNEKIIHDLFKEHYQKFPNYLFAKTAYAQLCMNNNELEKVPGIFNNIFMLHELYPERGVFHFSEVKTFYHVIGKYYCYVQDIQKAQECLDLLEQIDAKDEFHDLSMMLFAHGGDDYFALAMEKILSLVGGKKKSKASLVQENKMVRKKGAIPLAVQDEIEARVNAFNKKHMSKKSCVYYPEIKGKFIYLMYSYGDENFDKVCRLTYNGDLENMDFAIYKYSSEKYDANEWGFPGSNHVNGTLEGAMKAGLKAYEG